jgi:TonB family protein
LAGLGLAQQAEIQDGLFARVTSDTSVIKSRPPLRYPKQAMSELLQGTVVAKANVDPAGLVRDVAIVSGPEAFREAATEAIRQFRFIPGASEQQVSIEYRIPAQDFAGLGAFEGKTPAGPRKPLAGRTVKAIQFMGVPLQDQEAVFEKMGIKSGDTLSNDGMDRAQEELRKVDPKIQFKVWSIGDTEAVVILFRETARR